MTKRKDYFRRVLDLCDELDSIRKRLDRRASRARPQTALALVAEKNGKLKELATQLDKAFVRGTLSEVRNRYTLTSEELLVVALLLSHRVRTGNAGLSGRDILSTIFDSGYDIIAGMGILGADGPLRSAGIVVAPEPYRSDCLEATFRLSDDMFYAIAFEIAGEAGAPPMRHTAKPFSSAREHLLEMGRLASLYRKRAAALFPLEAEDFFNPAGDIALDEIDYRIEAGWADIEERLLLTQGYETYPLVRLERKFAISREEMIVVVSLFFAELVSPAPYLIVSDLVKLVSRDEQDLMVRRDILTKKSTLAVSGIVQLDEEYSIHRKASTCDAFLADWVVAELVGPKRDIRPITADMQIDLHEFLKGMAAAGESE